MICLICGESGTKADFRIEECMYRTGFSYQYSECEICASLSRIADDIDENELYPSQYYSLTSDPLATFSSSVAKFVARLLARSTFSSFGIMLKLARSLAPRRDIRTLSSILVSVRASKIRGSHIKILDVGSGSGLVPFVLSLAGNNFSMGIDPFAPKTINETSFSLAKSELSDVDDKFDLIMFHHSLEHTANPNHLLKTARGLLAPGGRMIIRVPTISSNAWSTFGTHWYQLDAPRHRSIPSRIGLEKLFASAGLSIETNYDDSTTTQFWISENVKNGLSLMDPASNYSTFRGSNKNFLHKALDAKKARKLNSNLMGDQTCYILSVVVNL
jgi:SAM-dependent methyltransferase